MSLLKKTFYLVFFSFWLFLEKYNIESDRVQHKVLKKRLTNKDINFPGTKKKVSW